jgi:hypothetical protein
MPQMRRLRSALLAIALLSGLAVLPPAAASAAAQVDSADALAAALGTAAPGDVLLLAPGDYGALVLRRGFGDAARPVTLRSADPARPARFSHLRISEARGLVLEDLVFDYTFAPGDDPNGLRVFQITGARDITFRGVIFDGDRAQGAGPANDGFPAGQGVVIRNCTGITVETSEVRGWKRGMVIGHSTGITLRDNRFHDLRSDGLNFAAVRDVLVEGNRFGPFVRSLDAGDHSDMIQFWTIGTKVPSENITLRDNILFSGTGLYTQSIFMRNEEVDRGRQGREMYYRNVTITGNVIVNAHLHGITVGPTDGLLIANNTLVRNAASSGPGGSAPLWTPTIRVAPRSENVLITANVTPGILGPDKVPADLPAWRVTGNLITQDADPSATNHVEALFVAPRTGDPATLAPFTYLPGGAADGRRLGAPGLRPEAVAAQTAGVTAADGQAGPLALIRSARDARFVNRFVFDAGSSRGQGTARWDFGDGTTAEGARVTHDFAQPGTYRVVLTLAPGGGLAETAVTVRVPAPELLELTPEGLLAQQDGALRPLAGVPVLRGPEGGALIPLGRGQEPAVVPRAAIADLFGAPDFTLRLRLRSDATARAPGEILRLHGSFGLAMSQAGGIEAWVLPKGAKKPVRLRTAPLRLNDGAWHDVELRYDAATGEAAVLVDGRLGIRARAPGPLGPPGRWSLTLGAPGDKKTLDGDLAALTLTANGQSFASP